MMRARCRRARRNVFLPYVNSSPPTSIDHTAAKDAHHGRSRSSNIVVAPPNVSARPARQHSQAATHSGPATQASSRTGRDGKSRACRVRASRSTLPPYRMANRPANPIRNPFNASHSGNDLGFDVIIVGTAVPARPARIIR
jgi:hypothetical protein